MGNHPRRGDKQNNYHQPCYNRLTPEEIVNNLKWADAIDKYVMDINQYHKGYARGDKYRAAAFRKEFQHYFINDITPTLNHRVKKQKTTCSFHPLVLLNVNLVMFRECCPTFVKSYTFQYQTCLSK